MASDEGLLAPAPADAQTAALAEIETLRADPAFESIYQDRHHPGQGAAQAQLDELYATAYPGDHDISSAALEISALPVDPEASEPIEGESKVQTADRVEREHASVQLEQDHGSNWESKVGAARAMLKAAVGDEAFEAVIAASGNDPALISELIGLAELDRSGMLGTIIRDYLSRDVRGDRATLEIETLRANSQWQKDFEGIGRQHDIAVAREIALRVLANPPKAIVKALQGFQP